MSQTQADPKASMTGFIIGIVLSAIIIAVSCVRHQQDLRTIETFTATATDGTVERVESRRVRKSKRRRVTKYTYYVSFTDDDHVRHEGKSMGESENKQIHSEGDRVSVRYNPRDADGQVVIEGDEDLV